MGQPRRLILETLFCRGKREAATGALPLICPLFAQSLTSYRYWAWSARFGRATAEIEQPNGDAVGALTNAMAITRWTMMV